MKLWGRWNSYQVNEFIKDPHLLWVGVLLCLVAPLSGVFWIESGLVSRLSVLGEAICWPFFETCAQYRFLNANQLKLVMAGYMAMGLWGALSFWSASRLPANSLAQRKKIVQSLVIFAATFALHFVFVFADYRLRLNQHIMIFWTALVFIFLRSKSFSLKLMVVSFYFWAGLIKFTPDWIEGYSFAGRLDHIFGSYLGLATRYVIVLELVIIWGLFAKSAWIRWLTYMQLLLFHLVSYFLVGYYYPLLMLLLTAVFPVSWIFEKRDPLKQVKLRSLVNSGLVMVLTLFAVLQMLPLFFGRDVTLTGEGRLFALHMIDASVECKARATIKSQNRNEVPMSLKINAPYRISCDPALFLSRARNLCEKFSKSSTTDMDWKLVSRHRHGPWTKIVDFKNFCSIKDQVKYHVFSKNPWILSEAM